MAFLKHHQAAPVARVAQQLLSEHALLQQECHIDVSLQCPFHFQHIQQSLYLIMTQTQRAAAMYIIS